LPADAFVYCAFHPASKITPDSFRMWMDVLRRVPRSVLWFRALSNVVRANLQRAASAKGLDPGRLVFAPFEPRAGERYFARHELGDLLLDAKHHNAVNSACDALACGLPVLTLRGDAPAARAGESIARAAGLPDLVADDEHDFVDHAVKLGTQPALLRDLKAQIAANRTQAPLFDTRARVRELEDAFRQMMKGGE
jgi:predicted O-linked N-acetylglucosamine transferase (SPINDLY family)